MVIGSVMYAMIGVMKTLMIASTPATKKAEKIFLIFIPGIRNAVKKMTKADMARIINALIGSIFYENNDFFDPMDWVNDYPPSSISKK